MKLVQLAIIVVLAFVGWTPAAGAAYSCDDPITGSYCAGTDAQPNCPGASDRSVYGAQAQTDTGVRVGAIGAEECKQKQNHLEHTRSFDIYVRYAVVNGEVSWVKQEQVSPSSASSTCEIHVLFSGQDLVRPIPCPADLPPPSPHRLP